MSLRYYACEWSDFWLEGFFYVLNILRGVGEVCPVEVVLNRSQADIWGRDIKPRAKVIKRNTGVAARRLLKSRSGNLYVYGALAVVEDGLVQGLTSYEGSVKTLEYILSSGENRGECILGYMKRVNEAHA